ncbi:hypothetical protein BH09BAC5_BH09BAC5_23760 [soil metagenome]
MFSSKPFFVLFTGILLTIFSCQQPTNKVTERTPGVFHIRIELGNSHREKADELFFDFDSTKTKQEIHHFKYDDNDSIVYSKSYEVENNIMDSIFIYSVAAIRSNQIFETNKFAPTDGSTIKLQIIANDRMISSRYGNVQHPSSASKEFGLLVALINKSIGDPEFLK